MKAFSQILTVLILGTAAGSSFADKAPIVGKVQAVDPNAQTFTVTSTTKGKTREVVIDVKPGTKIVRLAGATAASGAGTSEQAASLADLKAGWTVSVVTRHGDRREIAETVRVLHEH